MVKNDYHVNILMEDFIYTYFIKPIITGEGYNPVNTIAYAIGFLLAMFLTKKVFEKLEIEINEKWFNAIFLIAVVGGLLRAAEDWVTSRYGVLPTRFLFVTPGIYFLLAGIVLLVAYRERGEFYEKMEKVNKGLILVLGFAILSMMLTTGVYNIGQVLLIVVLAFSIGEGLFRLMKTKKLAQNGDRWLIIGQALDGFATAIALSMVPGYFEQHVVTNALISSTNPFVYPIVKIIIALLVVYMVNKWENENAKWSWILRLFVVIIGLGPGTRDTIRLLLGV